MTEEKAALWKKSGINRLSIGLQSADDRELKMLGRIHTYQEFLDTWETVRKAGFKNVNMDLISAIPGTDRAELGTDAEDSGGTRTGAFVCVQPDHRRRYSFL